MDTEIENYIGIYMIAYVTVNPKFLGTENKQCWMYPIYIQSKESGNYVEINNSEELFPPQGAITVNLRNGSTADDVIDKKYYLIKLNQIPDSSNDGTNYYFSNYNKQMGKVRSNIWFEPFSFNKYLQIIHCNNSIKQITDTKCIDLPLNPIQTNSILLECENQYVGPFRYEIDEDKLGLSVQRDQGFFAGVFSKTDFQQPIIDLNCDNEALRFKLTTSPDVEIPLMNNKVDFITNEQLIDEINRTLKELDKGKKIKRFHQSLRNDITDSLKGTINGNNKSQLNQSRLEKIKKILDDNDIQLNSKKDVLNNMAYLILNDNELNAKIVDIILEQQSDKIMQNSQIKKFINEKSFELKEQEKNLIAEIENKRSERDKLESDIKNLRNNKEKEAAKVIESKKQELKELNDAIFKKDSINSDWVKRIERKKDSYESIISMYKNKIDEFKDSRNVIEKFIDKDLLEQTLQMIRYPSSNLKIPTVKLDKDSLDLYSENMDLQKEGEMIVDNVKKYFEKNNRRFTRNEIINLLICFSQGFITTFAGEPGTGKTSLCYLFAKALGIEKVGRYTELSVERGWTSAKDYIGYYNPLTGQIEQSNPEVFQAFETLDAEAKMDQTPIAPYIILLDEANLSPIEHYWANFLRICDEDSCQKRSINLGGTYSLQISQSLHFLATVNFDQTTEELSPRFLDRSWIILLNPQRITLEDENSVVDDPQKTISLELLNQLFNHPTNDLDDDVIKQKWETLCEIYDNNKIPISPRDSKMIKKYCSVANIYMEKESLTTRYAPLDFAVAQKLLPLINGTSSKYKKLVENLLCDFCSESLPICTNILERIKKFGDETQYYQFFAR